MQELLNLPFNLLLATGIGYVSYWFAYHGFTVEDKIYKILVFTVPALIILQRKVDVEHVIYAILTVLLGILWRMWGKNLLFKVLFISNISNENNVDNVLNEMMQSKIKQIKVNIGLQNGSTISSKVNKYTELPFGPLKTDKEGNILIYVDEINDSAKKPLDEENNNAMITYIPKNEIKYIDFEIDIEKFLNKKTKDLKTPTHPPKR